MAAFFVMSLYGGPFCAGRVPVAKVGFRNMAGFGVTSGISLGPFPGSGVLEAWGFTYTPTVTASYRVAAALVGTPGEDALTFQSGAQLIDFSDLTVDDRPCLMFGSLALDPVLIDYVPAFRPMRTGANYVLVRVFNNSLGNLRMSAWAVASYVDERVALGGRGPIPGV